MDTSKVELDFGGSQFPEEDQRALRHILQGLPKVGNVMLGEVGSWTGRSTSILAEYAKSQKWGFVHAIDHFDGNPGTNIEGIAKTADIRQMLIKNLEALGLKDKVEVINSTSEKAARLFSDNYFHLFFIDADHRYDFVKRDIELWLPKVKPGGILCGHDFNSFEYDERFINIDFVNRVHHGVTKAVLEKFKTITRHGSIWVAKKEDGR